MRPLHRILSLFLIAFTLYLGVTGTLIQLVDLRTLFTHAPETDPNMKAIREGQDGTADFQVIDIADYTGSDLPVNFDAVAALSRVLTASRSALDGAPLQYIELRVVDGQPVGQAKSNDRLLRFDASSGALLNEGKPTRAAGGTFGRSQRNTFKGLHRMTGIGGWALWINILVGSSLLVMMVTGVVMYLRLLSARTRSKRSGLFWKAGGWWRSLHRWVSVTSAAFLTVVALSGTWLAVESLGFGMYMSTHRPVPGAPRPDPITPLNDVDVPAMADTTLAAYRSTAADLPIRVLRLRTFGGMPQGVVVTGGEEAEQLVFNATTGRRASQTEPGYPITGFPFGWQAHQIAKQVHRGDFIGLTGRWMDLFAGLSLVYLTLSGAIMYFELWQRRRMNGRPGLLWK